MSKHILVIDDEPDITKVLKARFEKQGYQVSVAKSVSQGKKAALNLIPDAVILDLMLPDGDGLDLCKELKSSAPLKDTPILMLTAKDDPIDELVGLEVGADEYIKKPFDFPVLHARLKKLFKIDKEKKVAGDEDCLRFGKLSLYPLKHKVTVQNKEVSLTTLEFHILKFFMEHPGRVFTRDQLLDGAWKDHVTVVDRAVDVHITSIRKKIDPVSDYIETVRGTGYRFKEAS